MARTTEVYLNEIELPCFLRDDVHYRRVRLPAMR